MAGERNSYGSVPIFSPIMLTMGEIKGQILGLIRILSLMVLMTKFIITYAPGEDWNLEVLLAGELRMLSS